MRFQCVRIFTSIFSASNRQRLGILSLGQKNNILMKSRVLRIVGGVTFAAEITASSSKNYFPGM